MSLEDYRDIRIDLEELHEQARRNREERFQFVELLAEWAEWVKKTPHSLWSKQQKEFLKK